MSEKLRANLKPINQLSKKHLQRVLPPPDPHQLYCLQLALWALEHGKVDLPPEDGDRLVEHLHQLLSRSDQEIVGMLLERRYDIVMRKLSSNVKAKELAQLIIESLHSQLITRGLGRKPARWQNT
jgi:hypothetical protein